MALTITTEQSVKLTGYGVDGAGALIPADAPVWSVNNTRVKLYVEPGDPSTVTVVGVTAGGSSIVTLTSGILTTTYTFTIVSPAEASVGIAVGIPFETDGLQQGRGRGYGIGGL